MRNAEIDNLREAEYGPAPEYRPDSILQGHKIGELILSASSDERHDAFDFINWAEIRPIGAVFLREIMTQMDLQLQRQLDRQRRYGDKPKTIAMFFKPSYEAWCAIRDVVNPSCAVMSDIQIARLRLENMRGHFTDTNSGPRDDIQHLNTGHAPSILAVLPPCQGRALELYTFHRLKTPDTGEGDNPAHPAMLRFAQDLTALAYPLPDEPLV